MWNTGEKSKCKGEEEEVEYVNDGRQWKFRFRILKVRVGSFPYTNS